MAEADFERRLARIEEKLDQKIVWRDVYNAEQTAIREAIANATTNATRETEAAKNLIVEKVKGVEEDVSDLKEWRKTIYALIATAYLALIGAVLLFLLQGAGR